MTEVFDELFTESPTKDIGGIVCCMNREKNLFKSLRSWVNTKSFQEIIVLDYGSKNPITNTIPDDLKNNSIIKIFRYEADYWHLTKAYNIAIQLCNCEIIVKLDADYFLSPLFFDHHTFNIDKQFITGNNSRFQPLWGFLMCAKKYLMQINGYNERMVGWGHDDIDVNLRLKNIGLKAKVIKTNFINHLPHQQIKNINLKEMITAKESQEKNKQIMILDPWTKKDTMSKLNT